MISIYINEKSYILSSEHSQTSFARYLVYLECYAQYSILLLLWILRDHWSFLWTNGYAWSLTWWCLPLYFQIVPRGWCFSLLSTATFRAFIWIHRWLLLNSNARFDLIVCGDEAEDLTLWKDDRILKLCHLLEHTIKYGNDRLLWKEIVLLVRSTTVFSRVHSNFKWSAFLGKRTRLYDVFLLPSHIKYRGHVPASCKIHELKAINPARAVFLFLRCATHLELFIVESGEWHVIRGDLSHRLFKPSIVSWIHHVDRHRWR